MANDLVPVRSALPAPRPRTTPQIVDQWGNPIIRSALLVEQAAPSLGSVRNIYAGHPADNLTPQRLGQILRQAEQMDALAYLDLAEQMEEKDAHYLGVLGKRKRSIAQLEITVQEADKVPGAAEHAALVRLFVDRLELQDELFDMLDAVGKGYSVLETCWQTSEGQWLPRELKYRLPRWFRFSLDDGETLQLWTNDGYAPLNPYSFVIHKVKAKSGLAIRGGLARAAAWAYLFKNFDLKSWVVFAEVYGHPLRLGKYGPGASPADKASLLRAVTNIGQDCAAMIPSGMEIEFIQAPATGSTTLFGELAAYLDQQMSKAVLGNTGTTDAIAGGHAVGKVHRAVEQDIERADARGIETTLNRDLVRAIVDLNFGPQPAYPLLRIVVEDTQDALQLSQAVTGLVDRGLKVSQQDIRRRIGLNEPKDGEDILAPGLKPATNTGAPLDGPQPAPTPAPVLKEAQSRLAAPAQDSIDDLVERELAGWREMTLPLMQPIIDLAVACTSYEEFLGRLPSVVPKQNAMHMTEALAKAMFAARLAGEAGSNVGPT